MTQRRGSSRHGGHSTTGICIVRIWAEGQELRIRVQANPDVEQFSTRQKPLAVSDVDTAVELVRDFLTSWALAFRRR
jgi:hypothetical protein